MTVAQELIEGLLVALKAGDESAADTLWDLAAYMTVEQRTETEARVHKIIEENSSGDPTDDMHTGDPYGNP